MSSTDARTGAGVSPNTPFTYTATDESTAPAPNAGELAGPTRAADMAAASSTAGTETGDAETPGVGADVADTLDLRLPDELLDLIAEQGGAGDQGNGPVGHAHGTRSDAYGYGYGHTGVDTRAHAPGGTSTNRTDDDLLDNVGAWGPATTPSGVFQLVPVRMERDLPLITRWMNDPAVAAFWELEGPQAVTENHLRPQLDGDGRSVPCLGVLDGTPMSYWEIYRADLDPLARHYPARPHDTGVHLLIGGVANRGRGLGTNLLRAVADLVLDHRPPCARVVAEPDLRNTPSVSAFLSAGFRLSAEVDLPEKRAALMVRDRALRALL
ncbi:GNAT family N-acetyltransferase [Streptomyces sp. NPDC046821]|uniref:GNAT family N-acetyltransferase n=1 Tax=Streptomyces sp. NPDC046821 TaxID=3154702 RepID=UPI0034045CB0